MLLNIGSRKGIYFSITSVADAFCVVRNTSKRLLSLAGNIVPHIFGERVIKVIISKIIGTKTLNILWDFLYRNQCKIRSYPLLRLSSSCIRFFHIREKIDTCLGCPETFPSLSSFRSAFSSSHRNCSLFGWEMYRFCFLLSL